MNEPSNAELPAVIKPVLDMLERGNVRFLIKTYPSPAKSASQAATLIGCPLGAIVKSLFFVTQQSGESLLVLTTGENRVSGKRLYDHLRQSAVPASPAAVLEKTGFPVGGVPPFGHKRRFPVLMDVDLMQYEQVWASAGTIHTVMGMAPQDLLTLSGAVLCDVKAAKLI